MRQAILVALALVGLGIGYGAGYLFKPNPPPNPSPNPPAAADASAATEAGRETGTDNQSHVSNEPAAPMMPEGNGGGEGTPYRAYEESLPKDILENGGLPALHVTEGEVAEGAATTDDQSTPAKTDESIAAPEQAVQSAPKEKVEWADSQRPATEPPQDTKPSEAPQETASLPAVSAPATLAVPAAPEQGIAEPADKAVDRKALPTWRRNAVEVASNAGPLVAIVIDDMGVDRGRTRRAWNLPGPLTLSFLTYSKEIVQQMADARKNGHELLLHVPMEPSSPDIDPGPNVLITGMPREEILANLNWTLDQADGYVGINNHMGSRFTSELAGMTVVMETLKERGLLFLDSVTSPKSAGRVAAKTAGVPFIARNIFLDHVDDVDEIKRRLEQTADLAKRRGHAVAIGHPRDATIEALEPWLKDLRSQGIQLAPLSAILMRARDCLSADRAPSEPAKETADSAGPREREPEPDHGHSEPAAPQTAQQSAPSSAPSSAPRSAPQSTDEPAAENQGEGVNP